MKLLKKGAEADLYQTNWQNSKAILKIRKVKKYRNSLLDSKIRKQRTIKESQMLSLVKSYGIPAPLVYFVNLEKTSITMQEIPGTPVHDLSESKIIRLSCFLTKFLTAYSIELDLEFKGLGGIITFTRTSSFLYVTGPQSSAIM